MAQKIMKLMLRCDNNGISYNGFKWNPLGQWTEALDWNPEPVCGGGLHGQTEQCSGFCTRGTRTVLWEIKEPIVPIDEDKVKVHRARIIAVNDLSEFEMNFKGNLSIHSSGLTALPENLKVGGNLNLEGCTGLTALPENLEVGGCLDLTNCTSLTALPENLKVGRNLNLNGCTGLITLPENLKVKGWLDLTDCTALTALPENLKVGGAIYGWHNKL